MRLEHHLIDIIFLAALIAAAIKFILFEIQSVRHAWHRTFPSIKRHRSDALQSQTPKQRRERSLIEKT